MALPIAATPTLRGKEALKFQKQANRNKHKRVSKKEVKQEINHLLMSLEEESKTRSKH